MNLSPLPRHQHRYPLPPVFAVNDVASLQRRCTAACIVACQPWPAVDIA
jgi:hypothetical protein